MVLTHTGLVVLCRAVLANSGGAELKKRGVLISAAGVRCVWQRHELETCKKRLKADNRYLLERGVRE